MRMRRMAAVGLTAAALMVIIAGCGSSKDQAARSGSGKTVALLLPESKTARYESKDRPAFTAKLKELCSNCKLLYYNADQDAAKQQQQVEAAITQGANILVLDPVDAASAGSSVARAKQSKIPVISYSRLITKADVDYFVSNDNEQVGVMQAQALLDGLKKAGKTTPRIVSAQGLRRRRRQRCRRVRHPRLEPGQGPNGDGSGDLQARQRRLRRRIRRQRRHGWRGSRRAEGRWHRSGQQACHRSGRRAGGSPENRRRAAVHDGLQEDQTAGGSGGGAGGGGRGWQASSQRPGQRQDQQR